MALLDSDIWESRRFDGTWRTAATTRAVVEPATGAELGRVGLAEPGEVAAAAQAALKAQKSWAALPFTERAAVFRRAGQLFEEHGEEIRTWLVREAGSVPAKAAFETHLAVEECFEAAALASAPLGQILPTEKPRLSMTRRVPVGAVGVIAPFNAPLVLALRSVAPALALGNAVVCKPDPRTAVCGGVVIARVLEAAGLPPGLFHLLPGGADTGTAMVADPNLRVISFTGSTAAGRRVAELAGRHLKRAHLELGGNSALLVLDDADIDLAVSAAAFGSFFHQGQICMTTGRHLVHADLHDAYVDALAAKAEGLAVGDPNTEEVHLGPLIDAAQRDRVHALATGGGTIAAGGAYEGLFYRPTVIAGADDATPAWTDEVFGPVAPVRAFRDDDEAVALASRGEYGLSLSVIGADAMRALSIAERLPTGIVHVNDQTVDDEANAPFGGTGASGTGARFGGREANVEAFTETRWITLQGRVQPYPF